MQPTTPVVGKPTQKAASPGRSERIALFAQEPHIHKRKRLPTFLLIAFIYAGDDLLSHAMWRGRPRPRLSTPLKSTPNQDLSYKKEKAGLISQPGSYLCRQLEALRRRERAAFARGSLLPKS